MPARFAKILLDGDPVPWDVAEGGDVAYERPTPEFPGGRAIRTDYFLTRCRYRGFAERRRVPHDRVTITNLPE